MNKDKKQQKQYKHRKRCRLAREKKAEKETNKMEREIEKLQNRNTHIVKETSEKELRRISISMLPGERVQVINTKEYRKQRRKRLKG